MVPGSSDLAGGSRILNGIVDMGAYEYNITLSDSDGDGLTDDTEVNLHGSNPLIADTDSDGLSDFEEVNVYGTSPTLADTDGDDLNDGYEVSNGGNPLLTDITPVHYVSLSGSGVYPYTNWSMAATNLQDAMDAASASDTVLVADGTYYPASEVLVSRDITIQSENGRDVTTVDGGGSIRCFNLGSNSCVLNGFTIINGSGVNGGGVSCATTNPVVTSCLISACVAENGGGMYSGRAVDCIISNNAAISSGGGLYNAIASDCIVRDNMAGGAGGGLFGSSANRCIIADNEAGDDGGGMRFGYVLNCIVYDNHSGGSGGGLSSVEVWNCTVCWNTANIYAGGVHGAISIKNSIVWYNASTLIDPMQGISGYDISGILYVSVSNTCSPDVIEGANGNTTQMPKFVDRSFNDFRLVPTSPCVNAGDNALLNSPYTFVTFSEDLAGMPRISDGTVDMGAYEYDTLSSDTDGDGLSDSYELANGLSPTLYTDIGNLVHSNASTYGYYTESQVLDLAVGDIGVEITNGMAELSVQLWQSDDLITWTNLGGTVYFAEPVGADKKFFRIRAEP